MAARAAPKPTRAGSNRRLGVLGFRWGLERNARPDKAGAVQPSASALHLRELDLQSCSRTFAPLEAGAAPVALRDVAHERQPEAVSGLTTAQRAGIAIERLEDP